MVGAGGTMGSYLSDAFEKDNEVIRIDRSKVDITSPSSMFLDAETSSRT